MVKQISKKISKMLDSIDSESKIFAMLGVMLGIVGFAIVMLARKDDKYAMYYAKQGLVLFIACIIGWLAVGMFGLIPFLGDLLHEVVAWIITALLIAFWIIGVIFSVSGEEKDIPIIGHFARKL